MSSPEILTHLFPDDGVIPNNPSLPLVLYRVAFEEPDAESISATFRSHRWDGCWVNGVFDWHHYHSNAHEVLGCFAGSATVRFGGPEGKEFTLSAGDAVVIPAGVAHCNVGQSEDFRVVGAYPEGQVNDMCNGKPEERDEALANIRSTSLPAEDPVLGGEGELLGLWGG